MAIENAYNRGLVRAREERIRQDADPGNSSYLSAGIPQALTGDEQAVWVKEPPFSTDRLLLGRQYFGVNSSLIVPPAAPNTYVTLGTLDVEDVRYVDLSFIMTPKPSGSQFSYMFGYFDSSGTPFSAVALGTPSAQVVGADVVQSFPVLGATEYRTQVLTQIPFRTMHYHQRFDVAGQQKVSLRVTDLVAAAGDPDIGVIWVYYAFSN